MTFDLHLQEPSLFAVAKLLETGLVNLHRVEVLWRPVTNHLLEVGGVQRSSHKSLAMTPFNGFNVPYSTNVLRLDNMTKNGKV